MDQVDVATSSALSLFLMNRRPVRAFETEGLAGLDLAAIGMSVPPVVDHVVFQRRFR